MTMRIMCSFLVLALFSFVFTLSVGCSREVATRPDQTARLASDSKNDPYEPNIGDVVFIDTSEAWALDRRGTALYRIDEGTALRKQATDFGGGKTLISFVDRKTGFAFCHSVERGRLWRTTDGGETWQKVTDFDRSLPDYQLAAVSQLHFVDSLHGWLLDTSGVWRTEDGGTRWRKVFRMEYQKEGEEAVRGSFTGSERAIVATNNAIYTTVDGGKVWKLTNKKKLGFSAIYSLDEHTSWAWSDSVERSDDGGNTWRQIYQLKDIVEVFSTHFINKNEGWAAGVEQEKSFNSVVRNPSSPASHGILLHTKDGGKNWDRPPMPDDSAFFRVAFSDSKHGWLSGWNRLYRTTDGGVTWTTALEVPSDR